MGNHQGAEAEVPTFRVAFGVGCWDFGLLHDSPFPLDLNQYVALLRKGLEAVSSLNNLEIVPFEDEEIEINEGYLTETDAGPTILSHDLLYHVEFDLYIPFRIQKELIGPHVQSETRTENFRVHIHYLYHSPVSYVELIKDNDSSQPSTAMRVVREYMKNQLDQSSSNVIFTFVGPTPFHADFLIEGYVTQNQTDNIFDCELLDHPGYADITFRYCTDTIRTIEEACEALFHELDDELSLFYKIHRNDSQKHERWAEIEQITSNLTEHFKKSGWRERLRTARTRGRELAALYVSLAQFEADHILDEHYTNTAYRSLYKSKNSAFMRSFLESALKDRPVFPTKQMTDLMAFIESRRSKTIELLIVLIAAVVGGIVGSLITSIAK